MTKFLRALFLVGLLAVLLAACQKTSTPEPTAPAPTPTVPSNTPTVTPAPPTATPLPPTATAVPTPTPTPPTTSAEIGPEGGRLVTADGAMQLDVPAGAFAQPVQITIVSQETETGLTSGVIDIVVEPPLAVPMPIAARLTWLQPPADGQPLWLARRVSTVGELRSESGETVAPLAYWLPLAHTRLDENGRPWVWLAQFSEYAALTAPPIECKPSPEMLAPPPVPEGFVYVGRDVMINAVYIPGLSTVPLNRPYSSEDLVIIRQLPNAVQNAVLECDVVVIHVFAPAVQIERKDVPCVPSPQALEPPPAPPGFKYVGMQVTVNQVFDKALSTLPADWQDVPDQLVLIDSESQGRDQVLDCDIVVAHFYVPQPVEKPSTPPECEPSAEILQPPAATQGYEYVGRQVTVNGVQRNDLSTLPAGYIPGGQSRSLSSSSSTTRNGVPICETKVQHYYEPQGAIGTCQVDVTLLEPPPAPEGFVYVGRDVVVNKVLDDKYTTVPLDRPEVPGDLSWIHSSGRVKNGAAECDVIVRHLFTPIPYGGIPIPPGAVTPPPGPKCSTYLGYEALLDWRVADQTIPPGQTKSKAEIYVSWVGSEDWQSSALTMTLGGPDWGSSALTMTVGHWFMTAPCPPCTIQVPAAESPTFKTDAEGQTVVTFGAQAGLSEASVEQLRTGARSYGWSSSGEKSFTFPPGTQISFENGQATITLSPLYCE